MLNDARVLNHLQNVLFPIFGFSFFQDPLDGELSVPVSDQVNHPVVPLGDDHFDLELSLERERKTRRQLHSRRKSGGTDLFPTGK